MKHRMEWTEVPNLSLSANPNDTKFSLQNISAFWTLNTPSLLHQVEEKISREVLGKVFDMWFEDQLVLS